MIKFDYYYLLNIYIFIYKISVILFLAYLWSLLKFTNKLHLRLKAQQTSLYFTTYFHNIIQKFITQKNNPEFLNIYNFILHRFLIYIIDPISTVIEILLGFIDGIHNIYTIQTNNITYISNDNDNNISNDNNDYYDDNNISDNDNNSMDDNNISDNDNNSMNDNNISETCNSSINDSLDNDSLDNDSLDNDSLDNNSSEINIIFKNKYKYKYED